MKRLTTIIMTLLVMFTIPVMSYIAMSCAQPQNANAVGVGVGYNNMTKVASNYKDDRYLEVYKFTDNGRTFYVAKGFSNSNYGGTSVAIIEVKK